VALTRGLAVVILEVSGSVIHADGCCCGSKGGEARAAWNLLRVLDILPESAVAFL
jgi:hypothetical protein